MGFYTNETIQAYCKTQNPIICHAFSNAHKEMAGSGSDPGGPASGNFRVIQDGDWFDCAIAGHSPVLNTARVFFCTRWRIMRLRRLTVGRFCHLVILSKN
jgi:hypothetical protein